MAVLTGCYLYLKFLKMRFNGVDYNEEWVRGITEEEFVEREKRWDAKTARFIYQTIKAYDHGNGYVKALRKGKSSRRNTAKSVR